MPPRGTRPTPTTLRVLKGNPGRRPYNEREASPSRARPACPAHLSDEARREWRRVVRELEPLGLLTRIDRAALAAYCQAWGRWVEAEEALTRHGTLIKAPSGYPMVSPYLAVANKALEQMRLLLQEFGMTPSSRSRVSASPAAAEDDEFERMLQGK